MMILTKLYILAKCVCIIVVIIGNDDDKGGDNNDDADSISDTYKIVHLREVLWSREFKCAGKLHNLTNVDPGILEICICICICICSVFFYICICISANCIT